MDLFNDEPCPLCSERSIETMTRAGDKELGIRRIHCPWCGDLEMWKPFTEWDSFDNQSRIDLRGIAQERRVNHGSGLVIKQETIETLRMQAPRDPAEAADRLLLNLAARSSEPGVMTAVHVGRERGFAFTDAIDSFVGYLRFLQSQGDIEFEGDRHFDEQFRFRLTLPGWRRVQSLRREGGDTGFIAMQFADNDALYGAMVEAARLAGWPATRSDKEHHTDKIDDWILNRIEAAKFVIVDTTENNAGASFEAGYALGLRRPVIWTVRNDWLEKAHFDFRQYNHLKWEMGNESILIEPLAERIVAAVGQGPGARDARGH